MAPALIKQWSEQRKEYDSDDFLAIHVFNRVMKGVKVGERKLEATVRETIYAPVIAEWEQGLQVLDVSTDAGRAAVLLATRHPNITVKIVREQITDASKTIASDMGVLAQVLFM